MTKRASLLAVVAALIPAAHAQSCAGQIPPLQPVVPCGAPLQALCLCGPPATGTCHYRWVCPAQGSAPVYTPQNQTDTSIPLQYKPPQLQNPVELMLQIQQLKIQQQQIQLQQQQLQVQREQMQEGSPSTRGSEIDLLVGPPTHVEQNAAGSAPKVATENPYLTKGIPNAQMWKMMSPDAKLAFVAGYVAGVGVSGPPNGDDLVPATLSPNQMVKALDGFFVDEQNARFPIGFALPIIAKRDAGKDQEQLDSDIRTIRAWANK